MNETPLKIPALQQHLASQFDMCVCYHTVIRWITKGCFGIRLRASKVGGRWSTSKEAAEEFITAITERSTPEVIRTERQHTHDVEAARQELESGGFYGRHGRSNDD